MNMDIDIIRSKISEALDISILRVGRVTSWVYAVLIVTIFVQVLLRYVFGWGLVMLEELEWHLYAVGFLIGLSYATVTDSHVRVDLLHTNFSRKKREWIEIFGIVFLWLPFIFVVLHHSLDFVADSWIHSEQSMAPMGLPYRWAIKIFLPIGFAFLALASISRVIQAIYYLRNKDDGSS